MINHRNETSSDHILTIEDPIEFLHSNKKSIINQREVGLDTKSFARALRSAVRAAPGCDSGGRNPRSRDHGGGACAGRHRSFVHRQHYTPTIAPKPLDRIINMFPRDQPQSNIPRPVAVSARHPVAAARGREVGQPGGGLRKVMMNTPHISELIKKGDVVGVKEAISSGTERGMLSFDMSLYNSGA